LRSFIVVNTGTLGDLYRHMEWADAAVWKAVLASEKGSTDQGLRDYLYHLHLVQHAFLRVWRADNPEASFPTFDDAASLLQWARGYYGEGIAYIERLGDEKLSEQIAQPWADLIEKQLGRAPHPTTVGETALQVTLHSMYHRGQVNARLRAIGGTPPLVDYIVWLWFGRPQAEWPSIEAANGGPGQ
jgi:uncharacterized damage-inducible protein DinB